MNKVTFKVNGKSTATYRAKVTVELAKVTDGVPEEAEMMVVEAIEDGETRGTIEVDGVVYEWAAN